MTLSEHHCFILVRVHLSFCKDTANHVEAAPWSHDHWLNGWKPTKNAVDWWVFFSPDSSIKVVESTQQSWLAKPIGASCPVLSSNSHWSPETSHHPHRRLAQTQLVSPLMVFWNETFIIKSAVLCSGAENVLLFFDVLFHLRQVVGDAKRIPWITLASYSRAESRGFVFIKELNR